MRTNGTPRLLFVTDVTLSPIDRGQRARVAALLDACRQSFSVTLVCPMPEQASDRTAVEILADEVRWVGPEPSRIGFMEWLSAWLKTPGFKRKSHVMRSVRYLRVLDELELEDFRLVWAERLNMAALVKSCWSKTVTDLDDLEHLEIAAQKKLKQTRLQGLVLRYRYQLFRWMELMWTRKMAATVVCSGQDKLYLRRNGVGNVLVVPNGPATLPDHPTESAWGKAHRPSGKLRIVFLGHLNHAPNLDAVGYFAKDILPSILQHRPDTHFDVIGGLDGAEGLNQFPDSVHLRGFVDDLPRALSRYDVLVAPIRFGSGTRVKILDAMACGIPIVATSAAAEDLALEPGKHLLVADVPAQFAESVIAVGDSPALAKELSLNASEFLMKRYNRSAIRNRLSKSLSAMASPRTRPPLRLRRARQAS